MSNLEISAALATRLSATTYAVQYENAAFTPVAGDVYVAESLIPASTVPMGLAGSDSLEGIYQVLVFGMVGENKGAVLNAAYAVANLFPRGLRLTSGSVTTTILRVEWATGYESGDRFVVPLSIYYRAAV